MRNASLLAALTAAAMVVPGCVAKPALQQRAPGLKTGAAGHIVIGPYIQPAGTDLSSSLSVVWWTDAPGKGELTWASGKAGGTVAATQTTYEGLTRSVARVDRPAGAGEAVRYVAASTIGGKRYSGPVMTARFSPRRGQPIRFAVTGDEGAGNDHEKRVAGEITKRDPSLLVIAGDVVYNQGDWREYRSNLFPQFGALMQSTPILPALGNHDVGNPEHRGDPYRHVWTPPANWIPGAAPYPYTILRRRANRSEGPLPAGQWSLRNYSVDAGPIHFLCLDSTADRRTLETMVVPWAKGDLAAAKRRGQTWIVAFWHHPPYTHGGYKDNSLQWKDIRDLFVPMLREAGVQVVFCGHDHAYQHMAKDGIHYVISGAGGAGFYKVDKDYTGSGQPPLLAYNDTEHSFTLCDLSADASRMSVQQIDENGKVIDRFEVSAR